MAWSTREIAELAGTTLRAVRHYHTIGLLEEPERRANGYKQYGVAHLVRILRIKRLIDLGFSLAQISAMGDTDEHPEEALRTLDDDLSATIERLQRIRVELALILREAAPADLPLELGPATGGLSGNDRSLVVVLARVLGPQGLQAYAEVLQNHRTSPEMYAFDHLPADAGEPARAELAWRLFPQVHALLSGSSTPEGVHRDAPGGPRFAAQTVVQAIGDLYNPAQIDVIRRIALRSRETGKTELPRPVSGHPPS
ncbi:MerR family transcriptional regulator [Amycolatopsis sp. PS_44_ISF1]|uniref:MerR family transcriptional regulator n=1 Tax=Amycolatopsis sp. PS_44_ISF1 TaxID=2974917 RepID=UPI0028E022D6|nr:MerR family transcriptional regulator [Amycolatopsis sp. PS_44_ISF1]MDT8911943.1 MerR family transcriptional regulator [Amycolatopsis sp. PS_44_ISF1]